MSSYFNLIDTAALDKRLTSEGFPFSSFLFWDTPLENINKEEHKRFIIERVLMRGRLEDFYLLTKMYSRVEIQEALRQTRELDAKTAHFCSVYFEVPINEIHVSSFYS